jgi:CDGSH-type Zn-finger protein
MQTPKATALAPIKVSVEKDKIYAFCTCGHTGNSPWCDGAHKQIENNPFKSLKVSFDESKDVYLCQCKQSTNMPFCDGSHKQIVE